MKVVVIGGSNFFGPPLVRRLVALGHEVAVFHRRFTEAELPSACRTPGGSDRWRRRP